MLLFKSPELREALAYLDQLGPKWEDQMAAPEALAAARKSVITARDHLAKYAKEGMPVRQLVMNILADHLSRDLASGRGFVYRGELGFAAQSRRTLWNRALAEMLENRWISIEDADEARKSLQRAVRDAG